MRGIKTRVYGLIMKEHIKKVRNACADFKTFKFVNEISRLIS